MSRALHENPGLRVITSHRPLRQHVREIWQFRELLGGLIHKELKVRYKNSVLGFVWSMAQPVFLLVVYSFVFSVLGQGFANFAIWLLCGLVLWALVTTTLTTSVTSITLNANLVAKVPFPRAVLPLSTLGSAFVHFLLQFGTFVVVVAVVRHPVDWEYMWLLPIGLFVLCLLLAAISLLLSAANVWARDTQHLLELTLVALFWANPIIYEFQRASAWFSARGLPEWLPLANPFTSIVITFQRAIYGAAADGDRLLLPDLGPLWYLRNLAIVGVLASLLMAFALWVFDRAEGNFAEIL